MADTNAESGAGFVVTSVFGIDAGLTKQSVALVLFVLDELP